MALFRDYIARRYYAVGIGGALLEWGSRGVLLVAPFIIAFVLGNLWLKDAAFWHQPNVTWPAKALLVVQGANPVLDLPQAVGWTSVDAANEFLGPSLVVPHFEVLTTDGNGDGWADWLDFRLAVPLPDAFEPTDLQLLLVLRYRVEAEVRLDLEVPAHLHLRPPPGATACQSQGTLRFRQRYPLFWNVLQPNASYFPSASTTGISQLLLPPLLERYALQNFSARYVEDTQWCGRPSPDNATFQLDLRVAIPADQYWYLRGPWEVLKFAWIQYFVVAYPVAWLLWHVRGFAARRGVVATRCVDELRLRLKRS